jgi:type IV secretion system protein VirB10
MSEGIIERGDAPIARAASPLWKWAFIATLVTLGAGTLAVVLISELRKPLAPPAEENAKPRLKFNVGAYEVPAFPHPAPAVPEPPPAPKPAPMELPAMPGVPDLPPPEPRYGPGPTVPPPAPMAPGTPAKHIETPEELAAKRRLAAPLSGSGSASASTSRGETDAEGGDRGKGGLDLSVTKTTTAFARRLADLTLTLPKSSYLNCILDTAIQSDQTGLVTCTLPEDVYGADGAVVLLDRGEPVT